MKPIKVILKNKTFFFEKEKDYQKLNSKGFGRYDNKLFQLDIFETMYLLDLEKIEVVEEITLKTKGIEMQDIVKKFKFDFNEYLVFKDLRSKGYYVASGMKFGSTFRVYDQGIKPGKDHSKWLVQVIENQEKIRFNMISDKNRIAHTTKKRLLFACIDENKDILYIENSWKKL